jgi:hypothetical protein
MHSGALTDVFPAEAGPTNPVPYISAGERLLIKHPPIKPPLFLQRIRLIHRKPKPMAFLRIKMAFCSDASGFEGGEHGAGLVGDYDGVEFALEEDHGYADVVGVQEGGAGVVAFEVVFGVADEPVEVVAFELVRGLAQRYRVADAVEAGACAEDGVEGQGAEGGVAACAAAADECLGRVDQAALGQMGDDGAGVFDIGHAPVQVQALAIGAAVAGAAAIVEVGDGKAALGPVLDFRVEHRVAG